MSSTRKAKDDSILHQARYASSVEFERGLLANLVAKRCTLLDAPEDRDLIWFVQYLSHQPGGLTALASELIGKFSGRFGTVTMAQNRKANYGVDDVREIRWDLAPALRTQFPLEGETWKELAELAEVTYIRATFQQPEGEWYTIRAEERRIAASHPASYPAEMFLNLCIQAAKNGSSGSENKDCLERELARLCLDPAFDISSDSPWYFAAMVEVLREYHSQWTTQKSNVVVTTLGKKVAGNLDYTLHSRGLTLMEGNARLGKSFAAKAWCEQHPGKARFVEVPPFNDDAGFFRALARGLGLGNFLNYKRSQLRERVESVLLTGDLLLVLDEAQRLWPQHDLRRGFPTRIIWVMTMANAGVPICCVATPQFITAQKAMEKSGWNSSQLTGRIAHYEFLPVELDVDDLMAVARAVMPNATETVLKALAAYARSSSRYLAAVDSIAKRALYLAQNAGRENCSTEDVRIAMRESVIPSDQRLERTLQPTANAPRSRQAVVMPDEPAQATPGRRADKLEVTPETAQRSISLEMLEN